MRVLEDGLNIPRLALDYVRFGLATLRPANAAIEGAMAKSRFNETEQKALARYDELTIHLGSVVGSNLFDLLYASDEYSTRVKYTIYSGEGAHGHATGDNPVAQALMWR